MVMNRLCTNCKHFLPNPAMGNLFGWCLQFYKKSHINGLEPRYAEYCRNVETLCGKGGKFFTPDKYDHKNPKDHIPKYENKNPQDYISK